MTRRGVAIVFQFEINNAIPSAFGSYCSNWLIWVLRYTMRAGDAGKAKLAGLGNTMASDKSKKWLSNLLILTPNFGESIPNPYSKSHLILHTYQKFLFSPSY